MNYDSTSSPLYGVQQGIVYGQQERTDELNTRIYDRSFPDVPLPPQFDPRPIPTKHALFPVINRRRTDATVPIWPGISHNVETNFNPGNDRAPATTYLDNIETETLLRNQTVALQHGANRGVYVPNSTSDLYQIKIPVPSTTAPPQPFPTLFAPPLGLGTTTTTTMPYFVNSSEVGQETFFNHTRTQLRGT